MDVLPFFDAERLARLLPFERLVAALRQAFVAGCEVPPRQVLNWPDGAGGELTALLMPAWTAPGAGAAGFYGVKLINVASGNAARGLPGLHASYLLHDAATGVPLALMDGDTLTARRTAAASALAASFLARPDARRLLVLGAGRIAECLPAAHRAVRPIAEVRVWARREAAAEALAARLREQGFDAQAATDLAAEVAGADIVSTATLASTPLVQGAWLGPASHLDLIGSFKPTMHEADASALAGARLFIDTDDARTKAGELVAALASGAIAPAHIRGTLADLCRGVAAGRTQQRQRTVFKSVGTALEDLAAATLAWQG